LKRERRALKGGVRREKVKLNGSDGAGTKGTAGEKQPRSGVGGDGRVGGFPGRLNNARKERPRKDRENEERGTNNRLSDITAERRKGKKTRERNASGVERNIIVKKKGKKREDKEGGRSLLRNNARRRADRDHGDRGRAGVNL